MGADRHGEVGVAGRSARQGGERLSVARDDELLVVVVVGPGKDDIQERRHAGEIAGSWQGFAEEHADLPRAGQVVGALARHADGEVRPPVAVVVAGAGQGLPEGRVGARAENRAARDGGDAGALRPNRAPVEDIDRAGQGQNAVGDFRRADGDIGQAIGVHVAHGGEGQAEISVGKGAGDDGPFVAERVCRERRGQGSAAEEDVGAARQLGAAPRGPRDEVGKPIAVHVRAGQRPAQLDAVGAAREPEADAVEARARVDRRRQIAGAENHQNLAGVGVSAGVHVGRAHGEVIDAVAVNVAAARHGHAEARVALTALDGDIGVAFQIDDRAAGAAAEDNVRAARLVQGALGLRRGVRRADDEVGHAVAVDIARGRDGEAGLLAGAGAYDARRAQRVDVDGGGQVRRAVDDLDGARVGDLVIVIAVHVAERAGETDGEVVEPVAVEIPEARHRRSEERVLLGGENGGERRRARHRDRASGARGRGEDIGFAAGEAVLLGVGSPGDQLRPAVAVEISGVGDAGAEPSGAHGAFPHEIAGDRAGAAGAGRVARERRRDA